MTDFRHHPNHSSSRPLTRQLAALGISLGLGLGFASLPAFADPAAAPGAGDPPAASAPVRPKALQAAPDKSGKPGKPGAPVSAFRPGPQGPGCPGGPGFADAKGGPGPDFRHHAFGPEASAGEGRPGFPFPPFAGHGGQFAGHGGHGGHGAPGFPGAGFHAEGPGHPGGPFAARGPIPDLGPLAHLPDITREQRQALRAIEDQFRPRQRDVEDRLQDSREALRAQEKGTGDAAGLRQAADKLGQAIADMIVLRQQFKTELDKVLTDQQKEILRDHGPDRAFPGAFPKTASHGPAPEAPALGQ